MGKLGVEIVLSISRLVEEEVERSSPILTADLPSGASVRPNLSPE